jgi:hypothetical protein
VQYRACSRWYCSTLSSYLALRLSATPPKAELKTLVAGAALSSRPSNFAMAADGTTLVTLENKPLRDGGADDGAAAVDEKPSEENQPESEAAGAAAREAATDTGVGGA